MYKKHADLQKLLFPYARSTQMVLFKIYYFGNSVEKNNELFMSKECREIFAIMNALVFSFFKLQSFEINVTLFTNITL